MQRIEVQHHTLEQVEHYVSDALLIASWENIADELRPAVFTEAVRLLASKTVQAVAHPQGIDLSHLGH